MPRLSLARMYDTRTYGMYTADILNKKNLWHTLPLSLIYIYDTYYNIDIFFDHHSYFDVSSLPICFSEAPKCCQHRRLSLFHCTHFPFHSFRPLRPRSPLSQILFVLLRCSCQLLLPLSAFFFKIHTRIMIDITYITLCFPVAFLPLSWCRRREGERERETKIHIKNIKPWQILWHFYCRCHKNGKMKTDRQTHDAGLIVGLCAIVCVCIVCTVMAQGKVDI